MRYKKAVGRQVLTRREHPLDPLFHGRMIRFAMRSGSE